MFALRESVLVGGITREEWTDNLPLWKWVICKGTCRYEHWCNGRARGEKIKESLQENDWLDEQEEVYDCLLKKLNYEIYVGIP